MRKLLVLTGVTLTFIVAASLGSFGGHLSTPVASAAPGAWTQAQVNTSIVNAVAYIDTQQNGDGSYGTTVPVAETGMSLVAYGVLANGNFLSLPPAYQLHVKNAITWLLGQQNFTSPVGGGYWADFGFYKTYGTGVVLAGLSPFTAVDPGVPAAIASGRTFLLNEFQGPAYTGCSSADLSPTSDFCGGWNYDEDPGRSDQSNSGFAMFGLHVTGGVPAAIAADNINWNHHVQEISTNPFATRNDGGASYEPGICAFPFSFCSNGNNSGTMLFSYGYAGVVAVNPNVVAGLKFGQDILDVYELSLPTYNMVWHDGATEDGSCPADVGPCDWHFAGGEGGFHYSLFSLTKGLGEYIAPNLTNATNWYAKVVDLLLTQQQGDGSWPQDGRDDGSALFATGLAVGSLGLVAVERCPSTFDFNFSDSQYANCFRDVLKGSLINDGLDSGGTLNTALNFTGSTGSTPSTWLTVLDQVPTDPAEDSTFGAQTLCADVLIHPFNNAKGAGVVALLNEGAGQKGLALYISDAGSTDRLFLSTINPATGQLTTLTSVPLPPTSGGGGIIENVWYRLRMTVNPAATLTVTGKVFTHTTPTNPNSGLLAPVGTTLTYGPVSFPTGVSSPGENGIMATATSAVVTSSVTNFTNDPALCP